MSRLFILIAFLITGTTFLSGCKKEEAKTPKTLTLQPSNNSKEGHTDTYTNMGGTGDTEMFIGSWTIGGQVNWRQLLTFDFSQIPSNSTILSAELHLYAMPDPHGGDGVNAHSGIANACYIERVTGAWNFTAMTWANHPTTIATNRAVIPQSISASEDAIVDVSALVKDMLANGNYGFKLTLQNEVYYNLRQYASSYHSNAALHPKLMITYQ